MLNSLVQDLFAVLDEVFREPKKFWEDFYNDREKDIPFFRNEGPDENLVSYFKEGFKPLKVLEIGCGPGRNAIYMASQGCKVDAIDLSENAINWAAERALEKDVTINFQCASLFDMELEPDKYDFIYDSGLFHHLTPHRRISYIETLKKSLNEDGHFGLVCFTPEGALPTSDIEIYKEQSLKRGIGYTEERLRGQFERDFDILQFRKMKKSDAKELFGEDFLWTIFMQKKKPGF